MSEKSESLNSNFMFLIDHDEKLMGTQQQQILELPDEDDLQDKLIYMIELS